ncbi:MAG TPA: UDP-3-O-(3-hydroxymyristoyl)glucosamine N-acyltransferase [Edaphobacter sp.]|nr:UDP-3-O-(3-hydroxymyristoyl)glucosamine N-acyltransferase [Edaphobacter sp.]
MARVSEIAEWLEVEAPAEFNERIITRVSGLEAAGEDALVFAVGEQALAKALASRAGLVLASLRDVDGARYGERNHDARLLWVEDARYGFSLAAGRLKQQASEDTPTIHATAVVGEDVLLGTGTGVGPGAVLEEGVRIGARCVIGPRVTIHSGTSLGDDCVVQAGAVLGSTGFGYARNRKTGEYVLFPQQGRLVIEDRVEIGANTTIDRGALGETRIGSGTKIDNLVHIGHNCVIGRNVVIAAQTGISGSSVVEEGAVLGGQVGIGEHATVGEGVILGGGAGVLSGKKMHGKGEVFWGRPARPLKEYLRDLARLKHGGGNRR